MAEFVPTKDIQKILGVSRTWLQAREDDGQLKEGVHFIRMGERFKRWNVGLVRHWLQYRSNPEVHEAKVREYLEALEKVA